MSDRACGIGVDGGGSKTVVLCHAFDDKYTILGRGVVGATNPNSVGNETARRLLIEGIETALREAGRDKSDVEAIALGMSGVDRPQDRIKVQGWMKELFPKLVRPEAKPDVYDEESAIRVHNDGTIALSAGTKGILEGVVVISGTGTISIAYRNGTSSRSAGWGARLGDVGCGFDIGRRALKAATFAHDGRGPETMLLKELLEFLHLKAAEEFIPWAYDKDTFSWQKFADLAPIVQKCADRGDAVAIHIFEKSAAGLVNSITAAAKRQGFKEDDEFVIVYAGGLLNSGVLVPYLNPLLQAKWKNAKIVNPKEEPAMGAVYINCRLHKK